MTNATKAAIIVALNSLFGVAIAFGVALTAAQIGSLDVAVNALLGLWVALTYKDSPKRIPETG